MLSSTADRDSDQVVLKEARRLARKLEVDMAETRIGASTLSHDDENDDGDEDMELLAYDDEQYPLVMVDQLWLWVVGDTVITCFPQQWTQGGGKREGDVLERILQHLKTDKRRPIVREPQDLVNVVVSYSAGVFNRPRSVLGLGLHDHFEAFVGRTAGREMRLFRKFKTGSNVDPIELVKDEDGRKQLEKLFNINSEVKLLDDAKDLVDELKMILKILNDQTLVMIDMAAVLQKDTHGHDDHFTQSPQIITDDTQPHNITTTFTEGAAEGPTRSETISVAYKDRHPIIDASIRDFDRMLSHANASYEALNHLLDLKQKHATVTEARFAGHRVDETCSQREHHHVLHNPYHHLWLNFFRHSILRPEHNGIPQNSNSQAAWNLDHIFRIVSGVSVRLALPFVLIAFTINPLKELSGKWSKRRKPDYMLSLEFWKSTIHAGISLRWMNRCNWWRRLEAKLRHFYITIRHSRKHREKMKPAIARTGQVFAYTGLAYTGQRTDIPLNQYITDAEAKDPDPASLIAVSHKTHRSKDTYQYR